jgi:hypothetical protein
VSEMLSGSTPARTDHCSRLLVGTSSDAFYSLDVSGLSSAQPHSNLAESCAIHNMQPPSTCNLAPSDFIRPSEVQPSSSRLFTNPFSYADAHTQKLPEQLLHLSKGLQGVGALFTNRRVNSRLLRGMPPTFWYPSVQNDPELDTSEWRIDDYRREAVHRANRNPCVFKRQY